MVEQMTKCIILVIIIFQSHDNHMTRMMNKQIKLDHHDSAVS